MNNRVSPLFPESFYFTDNPSALSQSSLQAYGPVEGNESNQYRTSSIFSVTGTQKAFTICTGQVFLQPNSADGSKVNLILKPYRQPIKGISIKYFIYRGLNKVDFIPSGDTVLVANSDLGNATEFLNVIWGQLKEFNDWDETTANGNDFLAKWIGYDPANQQATNHIDDYFFKLSSYDENTQTETNGFEMPMISKGIHLGNFTGSFGLEIVLNDGDFKQTVSDSGFYFDLAFARTSENIIDLANLPQNVAEKQYREAINKFIDASAYYGLHFTDEGKVWLPQSGSDPILKDGQAIYDDLVSVFHTKNNVYINIQGHLGRSYDYYKSYSRITGSENSLRIGTSEVNIVDHIYGSSFWPILILNESQQHSNAYNTYLLELGIEENFNPLLYLELGNFLSQESRFLFKENLIKEINDNFTNNFVLKFQNIDDGSNKKNVSNLSKIVYTGCFLKVFDEEYETNVIVKDIDTVFTPLSITHFIKSDNEGQVIKWTYSNSSRIISREIQGSNIPFLIKTEFVNDKLSYKDLNGNLEIQNRVLLVGKPQDIGAKGINNKAELFDIQLSLGSVPIGDISGTNYLSLNGQSIEVKAINTPPVWLNGIELEKRSPNHIQNSFIGITSKEHQDIITDTSVLELVNASFFFKEIIGDNPENQSNPYFDYKLQVLGENSLGDLVLVNPEKSSLVYSFDNNSFYSSKFSRFMISTKETAKAFDFSLEQ